MTAIIIDDENAAIRSLSLLLERYVPNVNVISSVSIPAEGLAAIERHEPDIVFLDVNMPEMNGFSLLNKLKFRDFHLVFTTAHKEYALQAIKHQAADYLLKPIDADELSHTIQKIEKSKLDRSESKNEKSTIHLPMNGKIGVAVKEGLIYLNLSNILYIESKGSYCAFFTDDGKSYLVSKNIGEYESSLPKEFYRVHKSYLVNIMKVRKYIRSNGYYVELESGAQVEIARRKKDEFLSLMDNIK